MTKVTKPKAQLVKSVHYCPATGETIERVHSDPSSSLSDTSVSPGFYPTQDKDGNLLETQYGLSEFTNHQKVTIQEKPEHAPIGQLPRMTDIVLERDLVDKCQPGDRVQVHMIAVTA